MSDEPKDPADVPGQPAPDKPKHKGGRPKGSKNKPKPAATRTATSMNIKIPPLRVVGGKDTEPPVKRGPGRPKGSTNKKTGPVSAVVMTLGDALSGRPLNQSQKPGPGRPKGSRDKPKAEDPMMAQTALQGETPLDFLLRVMREDTVPALIRIDCAKIAAPYLHQRLQAVVHTGDPDKPLVTRIERVVIRAPAWDDAEDQDSGGVSTTH